MIGKSTWLKSNDLKPASKLAETSILTWHLTYTPVSQLIVSIVWLGHAVPPQLGLRVVFIVRVLFEIPQPLHVVACVVVFAMNQPMGGNKL